jgi:hypothetical protein
MVPPTLAVTQLFTLTAACPMPLRASMRLTGDLYLPALGPTRVVVWSASISKLNQQSAQKRIAGRPAGRPIYVIRSSRAA